VQADVDALDARKEELTSLLANAPEVEPGLLPSASRVAQLTDALRPRDQEEAPLALR
jgi:site-specific DNA recombinase